MLDSEMVAPIEGREWLGTGFKVSSEGTDHWSLTTTLTEEAMLILTASEMARLDRQTIEEIGIPGIVLMENAARGAADFFLREFPDLLKRRIAVVAGAGNNAGRWVCSRQDLS